MTLCLVKRTTTFYCEATASFKDLALNVYQLKK